MANDTVSFSKHLVDNEKLYFGTGDDTEMYFDGTNQIIKSAGALNLLVSGDNDDYISIFTTANVPHIKAVSGSAIFFEADDASNAGIFAGVDFSNAIVMNWNKSSTQGEISSTHDIVLNATGGTISTSANLLDLSGRANNVATFKVVNCANNPTDPVTDVAYIQVDIAGANYWINLYQ